VCVGVAATIVALSLLATMAAACLRVRARPLDGVEGAVLFEASRIRDGFALYVDPSVGAPEYGAVPSRYYVLYPPLFSALLSGVPRGLAAAAGRWLSMLAFYGGLVFLALRARKSCRAQALVAAAFVGGAYELAEFGASARPDALAVLLATFAAERAVRRGGVDAVVGALFALAAWTKPNVIGMGAGVFVVGLALRRGAVRGLAGAAVVSAAIALALQWSSHGAWLQHLTRATGQPMRWLVFLAQINHRAQFFVGLFVLSAWAAVGSLRRGDTDDGARGALALGALAGSVLWCLFTLPKIGSAANYWIEPCVAAVLALAQTEPVLEARAVGILLLVQALWTDVASARAAVDGVQRDRAHRDLLARAKELCLARPDDLVVADEPGIEVELDGRLVAHAFPLTHAAARGVFPIEAWLADLSRPEIACVVASHDHIERPLTQSDPNYDYFALPVRAALDQRFEKVAQSWGWAIYARRPSPGP
jgi:hypothetical protein